MRGRLGCHDRLLGDCMVSEASGGAGGLLLSGVDSGWSTATLHASVITVHEAPMTDLLALVSGVRHVMAAP